MAVWRPHLHVPNLAGNAKLIWAYVTYNALMLVYTAINIPYTALLGVISPNPNDGRPFPRSSTWAPSAAA